MLQFVLLKYTKICTINERQMHVHVQYKQPPKQPPTSLRSVSPPPHNNPRPPHSNPRPGHITAPFGWLSGECIRLMTWWL